MCLTLSPYRVLYWCLALVHCFPKEYKADVSRISHLRTQVESSFDQLVVQLEMRKNELLKELDVIEDELLREQEETDKLIRILEEGHEYSRVDNHQSEFVTSIKNQHITDTENKLKELRYHRSRSVVVFIWDDRMFQDLNKLSKIILKDKIPYHEKIHPVIQTSRYGSKIGEIKPRGIAIDPKSNNIFIADHYNHRVQVFDHNGKYLYKFGEIEPGKVTYPGCIAIYDDKVFVSLYDKHVNIYSLKGDYINQFGNSGAESEITSDPRGIAISEINGYIYICDYKKDNILVYSKDLSFKTSFGKDKLSHPRDIELTRGRIYVLDEGNPCMHIFNRDHSYSHSIVSRGTHGAVEHSCFFTLDIEENILITDFNRNVISVFNNEGALIHQIGEGTDYFDRPYGIAIDRMNRILIADHKQEGNLKIF